MSRISVIIPVYNTAAYLRACLDSILQQKNWIRELILVDDGSTDESGAICDAYGAEHPGLIRVLHGPNGGAAAARNRGLSIAAGEVLSFVDSDDYLAPDMYERLLQLLDEYGADMAAGEMWFEKEDQSRYCHVQESIRCCWDTKEALIQLNSYRYLHASFCCALFRRQVMAELRFPEGERCEDLALLYQVMGRCRRVAYCSEPLYHYIQRPNSASRTADVCLAPLDISLAQLEYFRRYYPDLADVGETACATARMGINTAYVRSGLECPGGLLKKLRRETRGFLRGTLRNPHLPLIKKAQAMVFCWCIPLYNLVIKHTEHR